jgi:lysophospholipase L1-like esterase
VRALFVFVAAGVAALLLHHGWVLGRALVAARGVIDASERFTATPADYDRSLLVVGDSTGVGTGAADPRDSVAGRLAAEFPVLRVDNNAVNGARALAVRAQLGQARLPVYDLVLIQVGGNDAMFFTSRSELRLAIDDALAAARERSEHVALMSTGDIGDAPAIPWLLKGVLRWRSRLVRDVFMAAAARHGAEYLDLFHSEGEVSPFAQRPDLHYAADGLHPAGPGYGVWYRQLVEDLPMNEWLGGR